MAGIVLLPVTLRCQSNDSARGKNQGWTDRRRGKGKRGGLRVIYYHLSADAQIWLMTLYDKDEMADLSAAEKRALKAALEAELARRAARRRLRRK